MSDHVNCIQLGAVHFFNFFQSFLILLNYIPGKRDIEAGLVHLAI